MDWNRLVVETLLILLAALAVIQLARTVWHSQARVAECQRLLSSMVLSMRPETTGLAHQVAPAHVPLPNDPRDARHPAFNGAVPLESVREHMREDIQAIYDEANAP